MDAVVGRERMCEKRVDSESRFSSCGDWDGLVEVDGEGAVVVVVFRGVDILTSGDEFQSARSRLFF